MMAESQINMDNMDVSANSFDIIIEWLLAGLLAFMPLALGAVEAWSEEIVIALSGAIIICFLLKLIFSRSQHMVWTWAYIPLGVFLLIVVIQIIPLPADFVSIISPNTISIKTELLGNLPNANTVLSSVPLSFYLNATKHDLKLLLAVIAIFVVVLNVFRHPAQIKRLLMKIVIVGGIIIQIALLQKLFGNGKIYWSIPSGNNKDLSGPFINRSNYGQFINLSIGAAFGLLMIKLNEDFAGKKITLPLIIEYLFSTSAKFFWFILVIITLGVVTIFASLSRGGIVSMLIAAMLTIAALAWRRATDVRIWIIILIGCATFFCILYVGFDCIHDRLATLKDLHEYKDRWQTVKNITIAWTQFPVFGTGLGTHRVVYPMFDRSVIADLAAHAENEYAQTAEETGLLGLGTLIIFAITVCSSYLKCIRNINIPVRSAAYGLGFGISAVLIHSLSDFGQHIPANAILSAIFCALLIRLAFQREGKDITKKKKKPFWHGKGLHVTSLFVVSVIWIWSIYGANNARIAEGYWKQALSKAKLFEAQNWQGNDEQYIDLISNALTASSYQPENAEYKYWLNVFRWQSISRVINPDTGNITIPAPQIPFVDRIIYELNEAIVLCPTFGPIYCTLGQLKKFVLQDVEGEKDIRKAFRLAPCDPTVCFTAGLLDIDEGKIDQSLLKLTKVIQLNPSYFKDVAEVYTNKINRPDLAVTIAGDNINRLTYITNALLNTNEYKKFAEETQAKLIEQLKQKCTQPDAPASVLISMADVYRKQQNNKEAIKLYRCAISRDYNKINWRLSLAKLLAETGQISDAVEEAKVCLMLHPHLKEAESLIKALAVHPDNFSSDTKRLK